MTDWDGLEFFDDNFEFRAIVVRESRGKQSMIDACTLDSLDRKLVFAGAKVANMQTYKWLIMVVANNGRYEKTLELPIVPQVGMTIFRGGAQVMWTGASEDTYHQAPAITAFGWNLDEEQFEVEIAINRKAELDSAFWDEFIPL